MKKKKQLYDDKSVCIKTAFLLESLKKYREQDEEIFKALMMKCAELIGDPNNDECEDYMMKVYEMMLYMYEQFEVTIKK